MEITIGEKVYVISETLEAEELAPIFSDTWTGSRVWEASCFLSRCLLDFHITQRHRFLQAQDSKVIELGSGCGLAGLVASDLGGNVVMTDQLEVIDLIKRNVSYNVSKQSAELIQVCDFLWGSDTSTLPYHKYDYILISDCINPIYGVDSWRNLARSIQALSHTNTITYLSHERRGNDEAMIDFQLFSEEFLVHECIEKSEKNKLSLYKIILKV